MKKLTDQTPPRRFSHISQLNNRVETNRQREIDMQNQRLLDKIMNIMNRRNKSVEHARAMPVNVGIGGTASAVPGGHFAMFRERNQDALFQNSKMSKEENLNSTPIQQQEVNALNQTNIDSIAEEPFMAGGE